MAFTDYIKTTYEVYESTFSIRKALDRLSGYNLLAFDIEAQSVYSLEERAEAKVLLKNPEELEHEDLILCKQVAESSGLSYPELIKVTHFIFGISKSHSIILISRNYQTELLIFNWIATQKHTKFIIHNALFDLKVMQHRVKELPANYEDSQLMVRTLTNHSENWKAKVGLKDLMGSYYDPKWTEIETYDIVDYKDKAFLRYSSIDGAATYKLYQLILEQTATKD